jgi:hypothetical protein
MYHAPRPPSIHLRVQDRLWRRRKKPFFDRKQSPEQGPDESQIPLISVNRVSSMNRDNLLSFENHLPGAPSESVTRQGDIFILVGEPEIIVSPPKMGRSQISKWRGCLFIL